MPFKRQRDIVRRHPATIVRYFDQIDTADASRTEIERAPESMAFSTSSFNALAGLSTTSPAAIRLTKLAGSLVIDIQVHLAQAPLAGDSLIVRIPAKYLFSKTVNSARIARLFWTLPDDI